MTETHLSTPARQTKEHGGGGTPLLQKLLSGEQVSHLVFICRATVISPRLTKDDTRMLTPLRVGDVMRTHWTPALGPAEGARPPSAATCIPGGLGPDCTQPSRFLPQADPARVARPHLGRVYKEGQEGSCNGPLTLLPEAQ